MATNAARWRLDGQTCLITGASKGIGLSCAREFAALGADPANGRSRRRASRTGQRRFDGRISRVRNIHVFAADVAEREQRLEVFDWIADLDMPLSLVVNNAGTNVSKSTLDYSEEEVRSLIDTNLLAAFEICRLSHRHLSEHANAAIVNVGSVSGLTHVRTGSPYGMTLGETR